MRSTCRKTGLALAFVAMLIATVEIHVIHPLLHHHAEAHLTGSACAHGECTNTGSACITRTPGHSHHDCGICHFLVSMDGTSSFPCPALVSPFLSVRSAVPVVSEKPSTLLNHACLCRAPPEPTHSI